MSAARIEIHRARLFRDLGFPMVAAMLARLALELRRRTS